MDAKVSPHETMAMRLEGPLAAVDETIRARMQSRHAPRIPEVTEHLIGGGGKRVRPMLCLAAARMLGYEGRGDVALATAVEFIHTATLLHDDVVDESTTRRGRPAANLLWDNKSSVLVGDYLFARAFQLMVETDSLRVLSILSNAAATIAEGEVLQLVATADLSLGEEGYLQIVRGKTAALFSAASEAGGVVAGAPEPQVEALRIYGDALGIAFQMADDLIDWMPGTGKELGDDFRERKMTLPIIHAVAAGQDRAFWERTIGQGTQEAGDLDRAATLLRDTGALDATREAALRWAATAQEALGALPAHPLRDDLHALAGYVVDRIR